MSIGQKTFVSHSYTKGCYDHALTNMNFTSFRNDLTMAREPGRERKYNEAVKDLEHCHHLLKTLKVVRKVVTSLYQK